MEWLTDTQIIEEAKEQVERIACSYSGPEFVDIPVMNGSVFNPLVKYKIVTFFRKKFIKVDDYGHHDSFYEWTFHRIS